MKLDDFYEPKKTYLVKTLNGGSIKGVMYTIHDHSLYLTEVEFYFQDPVSKRVLCEKSETAIIPLSAIVSIAPPGQLVEVKAPETKPLVPKETSVEEATVVDDQPSAPETPPAPKESEYAPTIPSEIPAGLASI